MILERRTAIADVLATLDELEGNAHPFKPDALAPPVGYVDRCIVTRDGATLRTLSLQAEVVLVADGQSMAARQRLDEAGAHAWLALGRIGCSPQSMADEVIGDLPTPSYPAVRIVLTMLTECL